MGIRNHRRPSLSLLFLLLTYSLLPLLSFSKRAPLILLLTPDDLPTTVPDSSESTNSDSSDFPDPESTSDLDPGSWLPLLDSEPVPEPDGESLFYSGLSDLLEASSSGDAMLLEKASLEIERAAEGGDPHARSVLGFMYQMGIGRERDQAKAFLYHHFAANSGNFDSKMALAHTYSRQDMYEKSAQLYGELAEVAVRSFLISRYTPVIEPVRIHVGAEENKEALRKSRGEDDEDFQILEYQAQKGNAEAMYKMGLFYYFGLRGLRRDPAKALYWFLKAAEKVEPHSMELLGEIYIREVGVEQNYTKALEWLTLAAKQQHYSAYNGIGYLYAKGYGVEMKNYTKARVFFEKAANNEDPGGYYNLGVLYLKGIGVKKDVKLACKYFLIAANAGQPKAFYQLAKMFHTGLGLKKSLETATALYKLVAERGPWNSLFRWALEAYLKGDIGKASLLYSRLAELGYEVAQSNAAWILDKIGDPSLCLGASGLCMDTERHQRAHSLWWQASEQGNEHAALLIGDAYFYGKGMDRDYERAAEAYKHAKSQANAQALFNLGYMHEHGQGLPYDLHLAKRYYDEALETDPTAKLPVTLALSSLWLRKNYADSFLVHAIDALPELFPKIEAWVENIIFDEGNATILTLVVCLLTVLYLRDWQRRNAAAAAAAAPAHEPAPMPQFNDRLIHAPQ